MLHDDHLEHRLVSESTFHAFGTEHWHQGSHLADAAARAGLDLAALDVAIAEAPGRYDAVIAENQRALEAAGHWGVPTMVFAGEPFFGQDRIELLVWRMRQHGLRARDR